MDKGYEKEKFEGLKIKASVAQKFREFCKEQRASQSMNLLHMVDFFQDNDMAPTDSLETPLERVERRFQKRMNAMIAIIKDIEKTKMAPTHEMLQLLFQEATRLEEPKRELKLEKGADVAAQSHQKKELLLEKDRPEVNTSFELKPDQLAYYQDQYFQEQKRVGELTRMLEKIFAASSYVDPTFGSGYVKMSMEKNEFERMKMKAHVHHNHTTENG